MIIEEEVTPTSNTASSSQLIKQSDTTTFVNDVIEESKKEPVIVNFFSSRSNASTQLTNQLEKEVIQHNGAVKLANIDLDQNQQLAVQLHVQAVPTVFGFKDGQPVDAFAGPQPDNQIKTFINRLVGDAKAPIEDALDHAQIMFDNGNIEQSRELYEEILVQDSTSGSAVGGLIRCHIAAKNLSAAEDLIQNLSNESLKDENVRAAISALELARDGEDKNNEEEFHTRLNKNKNDHQARYDLALCLYTKGNTKHALEELLKIIQIERSWNDDAARKQMLKIFEALGNDDPITIQARRNLSNILFS